jgi:multimeric flavodoxin WrbA
MKVVGFTASPRPKSNTAWVVDTILEGAREQGAETQSWQSSALDLQPCSGCFACKKRDRGCVLQDDMPRLHVELAGAEALVLGTPVYMGQMSAQAKIFVDRLYALFSPRFSPYFKKRNAGKMLVLAFMQGNPDAELFRTYYDYTSRMFQLLAFDVREVVVVAGTRSGPALEQDGLHARLKAIGASLG